MSEDDSYLPAGKSEYCNSSCAAHALPDFCFMREKVLILRCATNHEVNDTSNMHIRLL